MNYSGFTHFGRPVTSHSRWEPAQNTPCWLTQQNWKPSLTKQFSRSSLRTSLSTEHLLSFPCTNLYQKGKRKEKQWCRACNPPFLQLFALRGFSRIYIIQWWSKARTLWDLQLSFSWIIFIRRLGWNILFLFPQENIPDGTCFFYNTLQWNLRFT